VGLLDDGGEVGNDSDRTCDTDGRGVPDDDLQIAPLRERTRGGSAPIPRPYGEQPRLRNGAGRAAMALGLSALVLSLMPGVGLGLSAGAVVLGIVGVRRARRFEASNRRQAQLGLLTGSVAGAIAVAVSIAVVVLWPQLQDYQRCVNDATTDTDQETCTQQFRHAVDERFR
jgi:hypothetical protein